MQAVRAMETTGSFVRPADRAVAPRTPAQHPATAQRPGPVPPLTEDEISDRLLDIRRRLAVVREQIAEIQSISGKEIADDMRVPWLDLAVEEETLCEQRRELVQRAIELHKVGSVFRSHLDTASIRRHSDDETETTRESRFITRSAGVARCCRGDVPWGFEW